MMISIETEIAEIKRLVQEVLRDLRAISVKLGIK
jgi:hypothetical protein